MARTQREVLEDVAAGRISPEEAAAELEGDGPDPTDVVGPAGPAGSTEPTEVPASADPAADGPVTALRIVATVGSVRVVGDPDVAEAAATGPHRMHRRDGTLVVATDHVAEMIDSDIDDDDDDFAQVRTGGFAFASTSGRRRRIRVVNPFGRQQATEVRVNPSLPISVEVSAASARVSGIRAPLTCGVSAGSCKVDDFRGSISGDVSAGSLTVRGAIIGDGELSCEAGSLSMELEQGSDVTVAVDLNLGNLKIQAPEPPTGDAGSRRQHLVVGSGAGRLDIRGSLASVRVDVVEG